MAYRESAGELFDKANKLDAEAIQCTAKVAKAAAKRSSALRNRAYKAQALEGLQAEINGSAAEAEAGAYIFATLANLRNNYVAVRVISYVAQQMGLSIATGAIVDEVTRLRTQLACADAVKAAAKPVPTVGDIVKELQRFPPQAYKAGAGQSVNGVAGSIWTANYIG